MNCADDTLALWLARQARRLGLNPVTGEEVDPEALRAFALLVLNELSARGFLPEGPEVGCWSRPRSPTN